MELQVDQRFFVQLLNDVEAKRKMWDVGFVSELTFQMLRSNDFSLISSPDISTIESDLIQSSLMCGRGDGQTFERNTWLLPSLEEKPLMCIFTSSDIEGQRNNSVVSFDQLEFARPSLVPPIVMKDWGISGFSEDQARFDLGYFACRGPLLLFSDNYLFATHDPEDLDEFTKDFCRTMLLFIEGLTTDIRDLDQILLLGYTPPNKKLRQTKELVDDLHQELELGLVEMGFKGNLLFAMSKKKYKGEPNSRHDRHIFTGAGQIVVSDSLRLFKKNRPYMTDTFTLTYRQYTETNYQTAIAKHVKVLLTELAENNLKHRVGHLNEVLLYNALQQLERD